MQVFVRKQWLALVFTVQAASNFENKKQQTQTHRRKRKWRP